MGRSNSRSPADKATQPMPFTFKATRAGTEVTDQSRKRSRRSSSSDSLEIIDESMNKRAKHEPISLNLVTSESEGKDGSESEDEAELAFTAPRGVTLIGDDEELVHVGMQKRIRAPRYFTKRKLLTTASTKKCFNCGQTGHFSRDCPNARHQKPCSLCAGIGHADFNCPNSKMRCFRCNRLGHVARDCPNPHNSLVLPMVCTRCGDPDCSATGQPDYIRAEGGCSKAYADSDLALVRCLRCFKLGHFSCAPTTAILPKSSCFNCGERGHRGHECDLERTYLATKERNEASNLRGLDSIRSARSDHSGGRSQPGSSHLGGPAPGLAQQHSYTSYPQAGPSQPFWQHDNRSGAGSGPPQYSEPPRYEHSYDTSQYAAAPPQGYYHDSQPPSYSSSRSQEHSGAGAPTQRTTYATYPSYPQPQAAPITLPAPQQFQHSYGSFSMGAAPPPSSNQGRYGHRHGRR